MDIYTEALTAYLDTPKQEDNRRAILEAAIQQKLGKFSATLLSEGTWLEDEAKPTLVHDGYRYTLDNEGVSSEDDALLVEQRGATGSIVQALSSESDLGLAVSKFQGWQERGQLAQSNQDSATMLLQNVFELHLQNQAAILEALAALGDDPNLNPLTTQISAYTRQFERVLQTLRTSVKLPPQQKIALDSVLDQLKPTSL